MPVDIFGFSIGRKGKESPKPTTSEIEKNKELNLLLLQMSMMEVLKSLEVVFMVSMLILLVKLKMKTI